MERERKSMRTLVRLVSESRRLTYLPPQWRGMVNSTGVVGVAQLVERRSVAPNVAGSSPVSHPNLL